ncbi:hypothetical protein BGX23_009226 [Mortierella sp. AD031]|nr:hypothetical protein BGX23_009226 [Mortierella sp. AD031]
MSKRTFTPDCLTSDGTTFYAHYTTNLGSSNNNDDTIILAKSNPNPASARDVTFSVVATAKESELGYLAGMAIIGGMLCHVDSRGVFTIIASSTKKSSNTAETLPEGGYQYTPGSVDGTSAGTWSTVTMTGPYDWNTLGGGGSLVTVPGGAGGKDVLMHVFATGIIQNTISFGIFDPDKKQFVQQRTNWTLSPIGMASAKLNIMPITSTATQPAASAISGTSFVIPSCSALYSSQGQSCLFGSTLYYMCQESPSNANYLITSDGKSNSSTPVRTKVFGKYYHLVPIGPPAGPATWAMINNYTEFIGVTLSGLNVGEIQETYGKLSITGLPGSGGSSGGNDNDGGGGGGGIGGSGLSTGTIAGIIAGVVVCLISTSNLCRFFRRRKRFSRPVTPVYNDGDDNVPNIGDLSEGKLEDESLPMASITPMPAPTGTLSTATAAAGISTLQPPPLAPLPFMDAKQQQQQQQQQPPAQNTFEDGYQQGFAQALMALRREQEQVQLEQKQQQQQQQRPVQNPQLHINPVEPRHPQTEITAWPPVPDNQQQQQYHSPQLYPVGSMHPLHYQQQQQQQQQAGYYQTGVSGDGRNPQEYGAAGGALSLVGVPISPLPAYSSGSVTMLPVPSYAPPGSGGGVGVGGSTPSTPYRPPAWTPVTWIS